MGPVRAAILLLAGLAGAVAAAAAPPAARVHFEGERYRVFAESVVPAPPERVMAVLTDYPAMGDIHPVVRRVRVLEGGAEATRVRLWMEDCILFFCLDIRQTLAYRRSAPHRLEARVLPGGSDFSYGRLQWRVEETAPGTSHVRFEAEMEPTFWLPPILGTFALEQRLKQIALETQTNLGLLVQGKSPPGRPEPPEHTIFDDPGW